MGVVKEGLKLSPHTESKLLTAEFSLFLSFLYSLTHHYRASTTCYLLEIKDKPEEIFVLEELTAQCSYSPSWLQFRIMGALLKYMNTQALLPNIQLNLKATGVVRQTYTGADD